MSPFGMSGAVHSSAVTRPGLVHGIFACWVHSVPASWMSVGSSTLSGLSPAGRAASDPVAVGDALVVGDPLVAGDALVFAGDGLVVVGWSVGVGVGVGFAFANGNVDATAAMTRKSPMPPATPPPRKRPSRDLRCAGAADGQGPAGGEAGGTWP